MNSNKSLIITNKSSLNKDKFVEIDELDDIYEDDDDSSYIDSDFDNDSVDADSDISDDLSDYLDEEKQVKPVKPVKTEKKQSNSKNQVDKKSTNNNQNKIEIIQDYNSTDIDVDEMFNFKRLVEMIYENKEVNDELIEVAERKGPFCENCNDDNIVEDTAHGIIVCRSCGEVLSNLMDTNPEWTQYNDDNKKDMNRCSHPISQLLPQSSTATTIAGSCSSRIKTLHGWSAMPYKERSLNEVFKIIQAKCAEGKILKCIEDDAKIMYKNISDCKHVTGKNSGKPIIIRGKNRTSVIAGCILYACRKKNKTRSPKEIAELFGLRYTEITKGCKIFQKLAKLKKIDYKFNFTKPEHFIIRFCEELKIKQEYTQQAIQISDNVQKLQIASVHTPLSLATGSIYLMIHLNGLNIQKKVIADKFNVSQVTIAKAFKKLEPFINILTNNRVCDKLGVEIKKYQDDVEIVDVLKPKFLRFNINIEKTMNKSSEKIYNLIYEEDGIIKLDDELIVEHTIEYDSREKQYDNEFTLLNQNYIETKYNVLVREMCI